MNKEEIEKQKDALIVKSNELIEARYNLSVREQRIILFLMSLIKKDDINFIRFCIKIQDFAEFVGIDIKKNKNYYKEIQKITGVLRNKGFTLIEIDEKGKKIVTQTGWLSTAKYFEGSGMVELEISSDLKMYLLQLKETFSSYRIKNVLQFKKVYSFRIYELLKQYQGIGRRTFKIENLRDILKIEFDKYTRYNDFKKRVLLPAQKELLKYSDIYFEFKEIKRVRKVEELEFSIFGNTPKSRPAQIEKPKKTNVTQEKKKKKTNLQTLLSDYGLTDTQIKNFENNPEITEEQIKENIERVKSTVAIYKAQGKKYNISALMVKAIKENWQDNTKKQKELERKTREDRDRKRINEELNKSRIDMEYEEEVKKFNIDIENKFNSLSQLEKMEIEKEAKSKSQKSIDNISVSEKNKKILFKGNVKHNKREIIIKKFKMKEPKKPFGY